MALRVVPHQRELPLDGEFIKDTLNPTLAVLATCGLWSETVSFPFDAVVTVAEAIEAAHEGLSLPEVQSNIMRAFRDDWAPSRLDLDALDKQQDYDINAMMKDQDRLARLQGEPLLRVLVGLRLLASPNGALDTGVWASVDERAIDELRAMSDEGVRHSGLRLLAECLAARQVLPPAAPPAAAPFQQDAMASSFSSSIVTALSSTEDAIAKKSLTSAAEATALLVIPYEVGSDAVLTSYGAHLVSDADIATERAVQLAIARAPFSVPPEYDSRRETPVQFEARSQAHLRGALHPTIAPVAAGKVAVLDLMSAHNQALAMAASTADPGQKALALARAAVCGVRLVASLMHLADIELFALCADTATVRRDLANRVSRGFASLTKRKVIAQWTKEHEGLRVRVLAAREVCVCGECDVRRWCGDGVGPRVV